jgi:hypothetical protein
MASRRTVLIAALVLSWACAGGPRRTMTAPGGNGAVATAAAAGVCRIETTPVMADSARVACERAARRYAELMGEASPPITVREAAGLETTADFDGDRIVFRLGNRAEQRRLLAAVQGRGDLMDVIDFTAHELGHAQLTARERRRSGEVATDGYGTRLADWFDEGVAMWNEPDASFQSRLREARRGVDTLPDLIAFTSRRHPSTLPQLHRSVQSQASYDGGIRCRTAGCAPPELSEPSIIVRSVDAQGVVYADTLRPGHPLYDSYAQPDFSAPAASLIAFLHDRGGPPLIREIARRLGLDMTPREVFTDLPSLPATPQAVNAAWILFVRALPDG